MLLLLQTTAAADAGKKLQLANTCQFVPELDYEQLGVEFLTGNLHSFLRKAISVRGIKYIFF